MLSKLLCLATVVVASGENAPAKPASRELEASVRVGSLFFWYDMFNETSTTYPSTTIEENSTQPVVIPIEDNQTTTFPPTTTTTGPTTTTTTGPTTTTVAANATTTTSTNGVTTTGVTTTTVPTTTTDPNATTTMPPAQIEAFKQEMSLTFASAVTEAECLEADGWVPKVLCWGTVLAATTSQASQNALSAGCTVAACTASRRVLSETAAARRELSNSTTLAATLQFVVPAASKAALMTDVGTVTQSSLQNKIRTEVLTSGTYSAIQTQMRTSLGLAPGATLPTVTVNTVAAPATVTIPVLTTGTWTAMVYTDAGCVTADSPASASGAIGVTCVAALGTNIKVSMCANDITAATYSDTSCATTATPIVAFGTTKKFRAGVCEKISATKWMKITCAAAGGSTSGAVGTGLSALATIAGLLMM